MDTRAKQTFEEFLNSTTEYCANYDFEPVNPTIEKMAWATNRKWFISNDALLDIESDICQN